MEHVVFYQSTQGAPAFRRMASIEDAVSFAEHLRNVEGVTDFSVYSLAPVSLSLRAYYHVEISRDGSRGAPGTTSSEAAPAATAPAAEGGADMFRPPTPTQRDVAPDEALPSDEAPTEETMAPVERLPAMDMPFVAGPTAARPAPPETFVKDEPSDAFEDSTLASAEHPHVIDPSIVDPTVEEVMPVPTGRRSMGFFARS
jgi:hypothetical protein